MTDVIKIIIKFINEMRYLESDHVLGCFLYGSFLTGYNNKNSDIDLHIIFDNSNTTHLIRGNHHIDGVKIEYFEKPTNDIYLSIENDYQNQNNALLSIIGTSKIIFDKHGQLQKLQQFALTKFSSSLPLLDHEDANEYVSILNNRMEELKSVILDNNTYFYHLYHLTIEKVQQLFNYSKRNVVLNEDSYRIAIKSRNIIQKR